MLKKSSKPGNKSTKMKVPKIKDYPKKIHLKSETYKIIFVKNLKNLGETDPRKKEIRIRAGMSKNESFKTFIHELLHFIEMEWPVKIKHKKIYKLEQAIFEVFIDNFT